MSLDQDLGQLYNNAKTGKLPAAAVGPTLDNLSQTYGKNNPQVAATLKAHQSKLEEIAYRNSGTESPTTPLGAAGNAAMQVGLPYAIGTAWNGGKALLGADAKFPTLADTAKNVFTPNFVKDYKTNLLASQAAGAEAPSILGSVGKTLPLTLALPIMLSGLKPLSDPLYQRGERGYLRSWWEGMKGSTRAFNRSIDKTNKDNGIMSLPINALNVFTNPLEATTSAANALTGGHLIGKDASYRVKCAHVMVSKYISKELRK